MIHLESSTINITFNVLSLQIGSWLHADSFVLFLFEMTPYDQNFGITHEPWCQCSESCTIESSSLNMGCCSKYSSKWRYRAGAWLSPVTTPAQPHYSGHNVQRVHRSQKMEKAELDSKERQLKSKTTEWQWEVSRLEAEDNPMSLDVHTRAGTPLLRCKGEGSDEWGSTCDRSSVPKKGWVDRDVFSHDRQCHNAFSGLRVAQFPEGERMGSEAELMVAFHTPRENRNEDGKVKMRTNLW